MPVRMLSMADYIAAPGVSKHALDYFRKSSAHYKDYLDGKLATKPTEEMQFGTLLHALVFEGKKDFVVAPAVYPSKDGAKPWNRNAAYCKEWEAIQTKPIVSHDDAQYLLQCQHVIKSNPIANDLITGDCLYEASMFATHAETGLTIKGRADCINADRKAIVDLKTCADASDAEFARAIVKYGYHRQAGLYTMLAELNGIDCPDFIFIMLETGNVPRLNVRLLCEQAIHLGRCEVERDLIELAACHASGAWPGYLKSEIELIDLPAYAYAKSAPVELEFGGETIAV